MAKKVFYRKRHKIPKWFQPYLAWLFLFAIASPFLIFFGTTKKILSKFNLAIPPTTTTEETKQFQESLKQLPKDWPEREKERLKVAQSIGKLKLKNFKTEIVLEKNCFHFIFEPTPKSNNLYLLVIPWTTANSISLITAALNTLQYPKGNRSILLVFSDNYQRCRGYPKLKNKLTREFLTQINSGLIFYPSLANQVNPAAGGYNALSIHAAALIPEIQYANLAAQLIANALPFLFSPGDALAVEGLPVFKIPLATLTITSWESLVARTLNSDPKLFIPHSFWLNSQRQLKKGALITIVIFLLLLCAIPLLNRLTLKKTAFSPIGASVATLYYSLIPISANLLIKLLPSNTSLKNLAIAFLVSSFILFFVFRKIEKKFLDIAVDSTSALFVFFVMLAVGSMVNPSYVLLLFPAALLYGFIKETSASLGSLVFLVGIILPSVTFWWAVQSFDFSAGLVQQQKVAELSWGTAIYLALLIGSLLSLVNRHSPRLP